MDDYEDASVDISAPWSWKLDPASGSSSSLGPSTSASLVTTDPLSSLSQAGSTSAADDVFWQDFRPPTRGVSRKQRKRMRLHRFDSDDQSVDTAIPQSKEREVTALAGSEEEDANGLDDTSSSDSDDANDKGGRPRKGLVTVKKEDSDGDVRSSPLPTTIAKQGRIRQSRADATAATTRLIARTIHTHASCIESSEQPLLDSTAVPPAPLTYKETVRLVRLIAMIFRFPRPSRRVSSRRERRQALLEAEAMSPPSSSPAPASTTDASDTHDDSILKIELKAKYLPPSSSLSGSRKPRMLAKVHAEDRRPDSAAVLKLIALLPASLPARVAHAEWVISIAVKARRDEHGNILLPDEAYLSEQQRRQQEQPVKPEDDADTTITRSMRQKLGRNPPALPLPEFWRRQQNRFSALREEPDSDGTLCSSPVEEAEVDALTSSANITASASNERTELKVNNLSKLLAERMREKRQAKTLLLRTHQSLRKRRSTVEAEEEAKVVEAIAEEQEIGDVDAETAANTLTNSGFANVTQRGEIVKAKQKVEGRQHADG